MFTAKKERNMQTIVIVGGGAGGLELATRLGDQSGRRGTAKVILIDRSPTHFWKPLLHEVASGKIDPKAHQVEYSAQAAEHHFQFICGDVAHVDRAARMVEIARRCDENGMETQAARRVHYDKLVLAFGAVTNFFGIRGAAEHSLSLDTVYQAEHFQQRLLTTCVQASDRKASGVDPDAAVDVVIVGGGATGIELAAELRHTARALAKYRIHALDPTRDIRIKIVERSDRLLPHLDARLSQTAENYLRKLGIEICTNTSVAAVNADSIEDEAQQVHRSDITLWAAGVEGPKLSAALGLPLNRLGQIMVSASLQTVGDANIFAIGDCSSYLCPAKGTPIPPRAQAAHQQALFLAKLLSAPAVNPLPHFQYRDYGSLVSLGPSAAIGMLIGGAWGNGLFVDGAVARVLYRLMYRKHVLALHGFVVMAWQTVGDWVRGKISPPVKLH
jgi:NADH dehydrogenase